MHPGTEWSRRHREEIFRSPGLWPYLVWVVREVPRTTVKRCGCETNDRDLEHVEEQGWEEEGC